MVRFSVLMPVYNKEMFISKSINSVLNQDYSNFEFLILDDGSKDRSQEIIKSFDDKRIKLYSSPNQGAGASRNYLINKAQYHYVVFIDADDIWESNHLKDLSILIEKYPKEKVFATNSIKKIGSTTLHRNYSVDIENKTDLVVNFFKASMLDCIMITSATAMHKDAFHKCGNYNPSIKSGQDIDLYIRLAFEYPVVFNTRASVTIVGNSESLSNSTDYKNKMNFEQQMPNESTDSIAKKYYDLNRYSLGILAKIQGYKKSFSNLTSLIDYDNLNWKQKVLLKLPTPILKVLLKLRSKLFSMGITFTVFK